MKTQIKLTESDLHAVIEGAVRNILKEYGDLKSTREKMGQAASRGVKRGDTSTYHNAMNSLGKRGSSKNDYGDFQNGFEGEKLNSQPSNNIVGENQVKLTEYQLKEVIKESICRILCEVGDTHRFGMGKYGLAMDAASKAKSLGRTQQADNLTKHGAEAFNSEYGMNGFEMDDYGQLRHRGDDGKERMYRPKSVIRKLERQKTLQDGEKRLDGALRNNSFIKNAAQTAKAFPRKKMTSGINAIDTVDNGIKGNI